MISPEEKIYSPQIEKSDAVSKSAEDNVPTQFAYVGPKTLGPRCLFLKKILIGCVVVLTTFAGMAIGVFVIHYGDLSKSHSLLFSMHVKSFFQNVKTYLILSRVICHKVKNHCTI